MEMQRTVVTVEQAADAAKQIILSCCDMKVSRPEFLAGLLLAYAITTMPDGTADEHVAWVTEVSKQITLVTRLVWETPQGAPNN